MALRRTNIQRRTVSDQIHQWLKQAIIEGELSPGERLVEVDIATRLGASRTPVREALSKLEQEGLVTPGRFGGLMVARLAESDVAEIFSLLNLLESYAARLAAERATHKQLDKLDTLCEQAALRTEDDPERMAELNRQFHELIVEAAAHKRLHEIITTLRGPMRPYRLVSLESDEFRKKSVVDHRSIVAVLRARDGGAAERLMGEHMAVAEQVAVKRIRESSKPAVVHPVP